MEVPPGPDKQGENKAAGADLCSSHSVRGRRKAGLPARPRSSARPVRARCPSSLITLVGAVATAFSVSAERGQGESLPPRHRAKGKAEARTRFQPALCPRCLTPCGAVGGTEHGHLAGKARFSRRFCFHGRRERVCQGGK